MTFLLICLKKQLKNTCLVDNLSFWGVFGSGREVCKFIQSQNMFFSDLVII